MTQASGFGKFVPGFDFLQSLAGQAASGVAQGLGQGLPQLPQLSSWVAPTFSVEELEKRIGELKAVHFWLDQNAKALAATIQALEVQKMTLATLETMNFSLGDVADALKVKPVGAAAGAGAPAGKTQFAGLEVPERTYGQADAKAPARRKAAPRKAAAKAGKAAAQAAAAEPASAGGVVDPMQWWGALSQQFQQIASQAMQDVAQKASPGQAAGAPAPGPGKAAARTGSSPSPAPAKTRSTTRRRAAP